MKGKVLNFDSYAHAIAEFEFLVKLGFKKRELDGEVEFISQNFNYILLKSRYGEGPEEKLMFLPEGVESPSVYIGLQYYLEDYWSTWRNVQAQIGIAHPDAERISTCCLLLQSNAWILTDPKWMRNSVFLSVCEQIKNWFQQQLGSGVFPQAEEVTLQLRRLKLLNEHNKC